MSSRTKSFPDGKHGYKPPYPGHEAMSSSKQSGKGSSQFVGTKKVTEGAQIKAPNRAKK